jgi:hypothetical protein
VRTPLWISVFEKKIQPCLAWNLAVAVTLVWHSSGKKKKLLVSPNPATLSFFAKIMASEIYFLNVFGF